MSKTPSNEMPAALERVAKAQSQLTNAKRRLSRAEEQVQTAKRDVGEAETEVKESTAALEAMIRRALPLAMKKGGAGAVLALGEIVSKLNGGDGEEAGTQQLPLGDALQGSNA